jgi:predicted metal-binding protein
MKKLLLLLALLPAFALAQTRIDAREIIRLINEGKPVRYENATITGKLDFTQLENRKLQVQGMQKLQKEVQKHYISRVEVPVTFVGCTFAGDVIGYHADNTANELYQADFSENATFENCTFQQASAFKYSHFEKGLSFAGSTFGQLALFKYTRLARYADFSRTRFRNGADFKYVKFTEGVTFAQATFEEDADFKYASFSEKSSLRNARFKGFANMKYTAFDRDTDLSGTAFDGGDDFKYAKLGGRSFEQQTR